MKKFLYFFFSSFFLCSLLAAGYWAGGFVAAGKFEKIIRWAEQGETLASVLSVTQLTDEQRNNYRNAYSDPSIDARAISWAVPNQPTPFVGTAPAPGQHHNAHINSWQMRSQQELVNPKPSGSYRIFLTGGSTAFGSGSPSQDQTIGSILGKLLNANVVGKNKVHFEVFTFANPAWSSTQERIAIENYLSELQPDLVVSLSGNNDVFWADAGRNVLWFSAFADDYYVSLINLALRLTGREALPELINARSASHPISPQIVARRIEKNVRLGAYALRENNVSWIFFLQPTLSVTKKDLTQRERDFLSTSKNYYIDCYAAISSNLSQLGLDNFTFADLSSIFDRYSAKDDMFLDQFHFGDKGNAIIAKAIFFEVSKKLNKMQPVS